ncbi:hypothetical protein LJC58_02600 [Lachnospiraceae bacterium OttesenSCG-928-D06]|nr:hypothetical protein [Lachnospiraceae bacterium OttesenSCG-928-D06]
MSKYLSVFLCFMCFIVSGCSNAETINNSSTVYATDEQVSESNNYWFFENSNGVCLSADVTTNYIVDYESMDSSTSARTQQVNISMYKVMDMQNGSVYKLEIGSIEDFEGYLTDGRLNIYFYVTPAKIYRIWSYVYEDNILKEFYNNDQLLIQVLNTEEKIISNSYLVCQQEDLPDSFEEGEVGMHNCIETEDNQVESRMWDITDNGETYFYESFSWELDKGLIAYRSGFRSERDILYLNNIEMITSYIRR